MVAKDRRAAVPVDQEHVVGITLGFRSHSRRSVRHTGHSKADGVGAFLDQTTNVGRGNVAFDHVSINPRRMA